MNAPKPRPPLTPGASQAFPVLPLRDIVVFPHMIVPLFVGREKSIRALEEVMRNDTYILLATQMNAGDDEPAKDAIYQVGTLAQVLQLLKLPDNTVKVLVEGVERAKISQYTDRTEFFEAEATTLPSEVKNPIEVEALARSVVT
jgi:ATP-dependent Lon protease